MVLYWHYHWIVVLYKCLSSLIRGQLCTFGGGTKYNIRVHDSIDNFIECGIRNIVTMSLQYIINCILYQWLR